MSEDIVLVYIILAIIYTLLMIYTLLRVANTGKFVKIWRQARYLYYFQFLEILVRACSFWIICALPSSGIFTTKNLSFILLSLPQDLILCSFITLFWIMLTSSLVTRFNSSIDHSSSFNVNQKSLKRFQKASKYFLVFWVLIDLILYLLVFLEKVNPFDLVIQHSALNFSVSLIVLISIGAAQIKYSGIPYISEKAQKLMKKVLSVILAWSFGIIIHGILYLIREENLLSQSSNLSGTESGNSVTTVIFIFDLLVTEVICFIFVNEFSFFEIFSLEIDDFPRLPLIEPLTPVDYAAPKMDLNIRVEDLVFKEEFSGDRNKMGTLFIGLFKDQEVLIRKLHLPRINNYVTEKIYEDLASLSSICCPHFSSPLGVCIHGEYVEIVLSYFKQGSLFHNLHKKRINYNEKLKIAREIAFCVKIIHNMEQVHGHLTSLNVMLDDANRAYVTDLGLAHLKKFCSITSGYCNKSAWSSPQILNEAGNVANKASSYDDVYSFGIILWEIITDDTPFPAVNIKQLQNMLNQGFRPGIPVNVDKDLAELMKSCWNIEPKNRPSFDLIHNTLCLVLARENGTESFFSAEGF